MLIELYQRTQRTVDHLPYTEEFKILDTGLVARTGRPPRAIHFVGRVASTSRLTI